MSSDDSCWLSRTVLDGRISGDEMEVRPERWLPACHGDAGVLAVERSGVERSHQRAPLVGSNRRTIQPIDSIQRAARHADRPFSLRAVGDRECRDLARGVVSSDYGITGALPTIVSLGIRRRPPQVHRGPPLFRVHEDRVQLHEVANGALAAPRDPKHNSRFPVIDRQVEAARIEPQPRDGICRPALQLAQTPAIAQDGVARLLVLPAAFGPDSSGLRPPQDLREAGFPARPKVQHPSAGRVPVARVWKLDVDVILI